MTQKQVQTVLLDGDPAAPQQARLGAALALRGLHVVVLDAPRVAKQIREEFGQTCQEIRGIPRYLGAVSRFLIQRAAKKLQVDVVHLNYLTPRQRLWADERHGPPYVATAWGSDLNREVFQFSAGHEAALDVILQHASAVTADSQPLLEKAQKRMGHNPSPAELVYWSADLQQFDPQKARAQAQLFRQQLEIAPDQKVLLSPRQPRPHYHIEHIVTGFAQSDWAKNGVLVLKSHGKPGEDGYINQLLAQAKSLGVADRVRLAPHMNYDELAGFYAMADAAVSMPAADGVPSTFLELMALEVPIVATDLPAYVGVVPHNERGLLVPVGDPQALTAALNRLLHEPDLARTLTRNARTWALEHADWQRSVDRWLELYAQAIQTARP